jgi:hypothetical protein
MKVYIDDIQDLAKFVAQLVREGVTFKAYFNASKAAWEVELTGGC